MSPQNHAAFLMAKQDHEFVVKEAPYTPPEANEMVIRTKALAINPADWVVQKAGVLVETFPAILGCDVAGEVVEVGAWKGGEAPFKVGDRVFGASTPLVQKGTTFHRAGFQEYVVLKGDTTAKIPADVKYEDAAVLPLAVNTAASSLIPEHLLGLSMPTSDGTKPGAGKTLIVWAASSSVGSAGVQLAAQAGYEVVGVASKRNIDMVKSLGAVVCFDRSDPDVVNDIVAYVHGKDVVGAYDGISTDATIPPLCEILEKSGGRKFIAAVVPGAEQYATRDVQVQLNFGLDHPAAVGSDINPRVWAWLETALRDGRIKCMPPAEIVGKGLEDVQKACNLLSQGVSAKKLVVSL